jgi:hypothetical protein
LANSHYTQAGYAFSCISHLGTSLG